MRSSTACGGSGTARAPVLESGSLQLARFERHVLPAQPEDLAPAAPGKRQEPDRRHRGRGRTAPGLHLLKRLSQPDEFRIRQEPLAPALGVFHDGAAGIR